MMILYNTEAGKQLKTMKQGIVRRHSAPDRERLQAYRDHVPELEMLAFSSAEYCLAEEEDTRHYGLDSDHYAHASSPIRRYADLIVHRALIRALDLGPDGLPDMGADELAEIAARISAAERRAMAAERETVDRLIATHLADQVGATFSARIAGVTKVGLFVKLSETGADGFIPAATLGHDYYRYDEALHALIGSRTGEMHRLGDMVEVKLVEVSPFAGAMRFEMLSEGKNRRAAGALTSKSGKHRDRVPRENFGGRGKKAGPKKGKPKGRSR
jgi:ribonuclease R